MKRFLAVLLTLAFAVPAFAQEHGGGENNLFAGDVGNAIWTLLIFLLVVFVLGKFAWGPILNTLQTRENFIHEALAKAKRDRDEAEGRLREYEARLAAARGEATAIVDEGRRDAEVVKRRIEADAKAEGDKMIERARREIQIATDTATQDLYRLSARLATDLAARVIGRELTPQDHERLIAEAIDGLHGRDGAKSH
ncbi:MAG TPA: F0F1 ATP synthase subunit B [Thermoanaerobaculia bacterium]|jgi:F-type H+-transporting ATPase subunit b|nr:F0F1 ATP synthase subunit B [Thermoanaerobaculia bacterium]